MPATIQDIKSIFANDGYSIERDKANSRRFIVSKGSKEVAKIKMPYSMDEFMSSLKKLGCAGYISENDVTNSTRSSSGKAHKTYSRKSKSNSRKADSELVTGKQIPVTLRKRREAAAEQAAEQVASAETENTPAQQTPAMPQPVSYKQPTAMHEIDDVLASKYFNKVIDYNIKAPKEHKGYFFPKCTTAILHRVEIARNVFLAGPSGTGKTEFVQNLGNLLGQKVVRVNFSVGTTEQHLIGRWTVKNGETEFIYGVLPMAMKYGWWILLDEIDYAMPEHLAVIQPVLEGEPLLITQNRNEEIIPHENFRVFATGNTKGRGDETQSYVGTGNLNLAFLDRWSIFEFRYTEKEPLIVGRIVKDEKLTDQIVQFFEILRKASADGQIINAVFSTRRLIQLAEALEYGESLKEALQHEIFSRYDKHEVDIIMEYAYDVWDREHYFSKNWAIGADHYAPPAPVTSVLPNVPLGKK